MLILGGEGRSGRRVSGARRARPWTLWPCVPCGARLRDCRGWHLLHCHGRKLEGRLCSAGRARLRGRLALPGGAQSAPYCRTSRCKGDSPLLTVISESLAPSLAAPRAGRIVTTLAGTSVAVPKHMPDASRHRYLDNHTRTLQFHRPRALQDESVVVMLRPQCGRACMSLPANPRLFPRPGHRAADAPLECRQACCQQTRQRLRPLFVSQSSGQPPVATVSCEFSGVRQRRN